MRDFLDQLDERLAQVAAEVEPASPAPARRRRARRSVLGGLGATIAVGAAAFTMTGTSAADLPILSAPTTDASHIRAAVPAVAKRGVDFTKAHAFGTPDGPGYVLVTPSSDTVCLAVPDPVIPGSFGSACDSPLAKVERDGLAADLPGGTSDDRNPTTLVVFVLPDGAKSVRVQSGPTTRAPKPEDGVLVLRATTATVVSWTADGRPGQRRFEGPFAADAGAVVQCPDGRSVALPQLDQPQATSAAQAAESAARFAAARRKACAR